jgi:hypothetical protein
MLGTYKLILDTHSEVYRELLPWADGEFWDLSQHDIVPGAVYVICREQVNRFGKLIQELAQDGRIKLVIDNAAEGSETLVTWCVIKSMADLLQQKKMLLIGGGDMSPGWPYFKYEYFLPKILDFDENVAIAENNQHFYQAHDRPYKFLFLNGRMRSHRKYLLEKFKLSGLLDQALWTNLDRNLFLVKNLHQGRWYKFETHNDHNIQLHLWHEGQDLMNRDIEIKLLPKQYEYVKHRKHMDKPINHSFVKSQLFNNTWGDAVIDARAYADTYFSLVTETVFNYPYSFRTEKIWKPIALGHPWIAVANSGFYRDLKNIGFRTFDHVIDESFDQIENSQDRIERVAQVVEDLCQQDLAKFVQECYNVCKYNQQHYAELRHKVPQQLPDDFLKFIDRHLNE